MAGSFRVYEENKITVTLDGTNGESYATLKARREELLAKAKEVAESRGLKIPYDNTNLHHGGGLEYRPATTDSEERQAVFSLSFFASRPAPKTTPDE